jgi:thioredoxin-related protein
MQDLQILCAMNKTLLTLGSALLLVARVVAAEGWGTDIAAAKALAKKQGQPILLDFTGSDWCGWCIKMKKESLDQKAFKDFAAKNVVLVEVDFPNKSTLSAETKKQNDDLKKQYKVNGFPTFLLIDADGKELGRQVGYLKGGPDAFIAKIGEWKKAAK